jgi:hypothetical protein
MIDWWNLSCNSNADAVELLKKNQIKLFGLVYRHTNTEAVELLKHN